MTPPPADGALLAVGSHDNFIYLYTVADKGRKYTRYGKCTVSVCVCVCVCIVGYNHFKRMYSLNKQMSIHYPYLQVCYETDKIGKISFIN